MPAEKKIKVGGREFNLAPFTIGFTEEILERVEALGKLKGKDQTTSLIETVRAGLALKNEDVPDAAWFRKNVFTGDLGALYTEMMKAGGMRTLEPGEAGSP